MTSNSFGFSQRHYVPVAQELLSLPKKPFLLLEVGAENKLLKKVLPGNFVYHSLGLEFDPQLEPYTYNFNLDDGKLPIRDSSYDVVVCLETLEHCLYPHKVIQELLRVGKKNCLFLFSMPNEYNFVLRLYHFFGKKTIIQAPFRTVEKHYHVHEPRVKDILDIFSEYFLIDKVHYLWQSSHAGDTFKTKYLFRVIDKTINWLAPIYPSLFTRTVICKMRRKQ